MFVRSMLVLVLLLGFLSASLLTGCNDSSALPPDPTQSPADFLNNALDWIQAHAATERNLDWQRVRKEALAMSPDPTSPADTYPAIRFALHQLGNYAFLFPPFDSSDSRDPELHMLYPDGLVFRLAPGGAAAQAGVQVGDVVEQINGAPLQPYEGFAPADLSSWIAETVKASTYTLTLHKGGSAPPVQITYPAGSAFTPDKPVVRRLDAADVGYVELPPGAGSSYAPAIQEGMREVDSPPVCGWIVDLRRAPTGVLWTMLAAIGPLLGDGQLGGFLFPDGTRESWSYQGGKVLLNGEEEPEGEVDGDIYQPGRAMPPLALLVSKVTQAAPEALVAAFEGRPNTRIFGEATSGAPVLVYATELSDGAQIYVSRAYALDRNGTVYSGPIQPDQVVATDWPRFGTPNDPVIGAASEWLQTQPGCSR